MADNIDFALNDHFYDFVDDWNYKFYFLVGGYGSSKSYHVRCFDGLYERAWIASYV